MLLKTGVTTIDRMDVTMPRVARPLNNTQINNAKPKDKEYNLSDGDSLFKLTSAPINICGHELEL
ncbi:hypothetical protein [Catenovulum sediminis]|uniref:hypothetical protein n=1 Tax=Catenovulum sediminis TaxID=1740262 RepID=UPI001180D125|nr:hypothetical protein [Catenovulum sediminis]